MKEPSFTKVSGPLGEYWMRDLDFEVVKEGAYQYKLEDGTILEARLVAVKTGRGEDRESGETIYNDLGEPVYNIRHQIVVTARVPQRLMKEENDK